MEQLWRLKAPVLGSGRDFPRALGTVHESRGTTANDSTKTCQHNSQTNFVFPGMAMGLMGKVMSQVRLSGTSCCSEFRASVHEISFPV